MSIELLTSMDGKSPLSLSHWLWNLLRERFFMPCRIHVSSKKNEKNIYCLDCCVSICSHCCPLHASHPLLQVRRYVYHDVLRLRDTRKLFDCSLVQPYTTNSAKVVFLRQRPMSRRLLNTGNSCATCERGLQENYTFCSISCKAQHQKERKMRPQTEFLPSCDSQQNCSWSETLRMSPEFTRKKRSSLPMLHGIQHCLQNTDMAVLMNRRKGIPRRSPLY